MGSCRTVWVPEGVDITVPDASRVYDYALGGVHNFAVDREFWHRAEAANPRRGWSLGPTVRFSVGPCGGWPRPAFVSSWTSGRAFRRSATCMKSRRRPIRTARVMYVDIDPITVQQSRSLLTGNPYARVIEGDLRKPEGMLYHPDVLQLLDFGEPVAVLTVAVLHFVPDTADPAGIIRQLGDALVSGSYLVISHLGPDVTPQGRAQQERARKLYERTPTPVVIRDADEIAALLGDAFELVAPGVVSATDWHPDPDEADDPPQPTALVVVARKR